MFALYKGNDFIQIGTAKELGEILNCSYYNIYKLADSGLMNRDGYRVEHTRSGRFNLYNLYKNGKRVMQGDRYELSNETDLSPDYINQLARNHKTTTDGYSVAKAN